MRTTIRLDDQLAAELKQRAAASGRTMTAIIEDALRTLLRRHTQSPSPERRVQLPTYGGSGLLSGVDLDDSADLEDRMSKDG